MNILQQPKLTNNKAFQDDRGVFVPLSLINHNMWVQSNVSINPKKLTLRGLHFQVNPHAQAKLIKVIDGAIIDFVVDIREDTEDYLKLHIFDMQPGDELFVPRNFAHGFITTKDNTVVQYLVDNAYMPKAEGSIVWTKFLPLMMKFNTIPNFNVHDIVINEKDLVTKNIDI